MKRLTIGASAVLVALLLIAASSGIASATSPPKLSLSCANKGKVGSSVRVTVTVTSTTPAYEIWIYGKTGSSWRKMATATLVSAGHYTAYIKLTTHGKLQLRAAFVDKSKSVKAYSNTVTVSVT
jgi:hypothetical protein